MMIDPSQEVIVVTEDQEYAVQVIVAVIEEEKEASNEVNINCYGILVLQPAVL